MDKKFVFGALGIVVLAAVVAVILMRPDGDDVPLRKDPGLQAAPAGSKQAAVVTAGETAPVWYPVPALGIEMQLPAMTAKTLVMRPMEGTDDTVILSTPTLDRLCGTQQVIPLGVVRKADATSDPATVVNGFIYEGPQGTCSMQQSDVPVETAHIAKVFGADGAGAVMKAALATIRPISK